MRTVFSIYNQIIIPFLLLAILTSCSLSHIEQATVPTSTDTPATAPSTPTQTTTVEPLPIIRATALALPSGLIVEEYEIKRFMSELEGRYFEPVYGEMETVFTKRESERNRSNPDQVPLPNVVGTNPVDVQVGEDTLSVYLEWANSQPGTEQAPSTVVHVTREGQPIYNMDLGPFAVVYPLRGVWVYDDQWVVEVAKVIKLEELPSGQIIDNGELINEKNGYDEAFGYQTMNGKPFYFFKRGENIGAMFDGQEIDLGYEIVSHYQCCSGGAFNPIVAKNMVSFFAHRQGIWYYVEIGVYK